MERVPQGTLTRRAIGTPSPIARLPLLLSSSLLLLSPSPSRPSRPHVTVTFAFVITYALPAASSAEMTLRVSRVSGPTSETTDCVT